MLGAVEAFQRCWFRVMLSIQYEVRACAVLGDSPDLVPPESALRPRLEISRRRPL
jgi:hypothetical protein